jgi:MerR family transcriptional regulator, mercuric resistance operon regulatory protein
MASARSRGFALGSVGRIFRLAGHAWRLHPVAATGSRGIFALPADSQQPATLPIGELSRRTGVNIETIRYYERIAMLPVPQRTASGRRIYGPPETQTLRFIRRARELGFTLDQIRALLALSAASGRESCAEARELTAGHLAEVRAKIADLTRMEQILADAVRRCDAGEAAGCPVLDALSAA